MEPPNLPVKFSPGFPPDLAHSPEEFIEGLPYLMVSMLERRYLSALQLQDWVVDGGESGPHRPLLREIVRLGKGRAVDDGQGAMPHLLTACHSPGHSLVMAVHGEGDRHRIYIGGRRCNDSSPTATPDYLEHLQFALKAYFSGLEMSADAKRLDGRDMPGLANLLQTAPALGVMTGIPSGRNRQPLGDFQSIDRLVDSLGRHKYVLMTVAEPLEPWIIDQTLDLCRRLKSEVHAWTEMTISRTRQKTDSETSQEAPPEDASVAGHLPAVLFTLAGFMQVAGFGLGSAMRSLGYAAASFGSHKPPPNTKQVSRATGTSDSATVQILNANAEACEGLLDQYIVRLTAGRSTGWWQTALYIAAESEAGLHAVAAAVRGVGTGDGTSLEPLRLLPLPSHLVRGAIEQGRIVSLQPSAGGPSHPLGPAFDAAATCLNSAELAAILNLPRREIPGLPMREHAEFGLCVPPPDGVGIEIGALLDGAGRRLEPVTVPLSALNRHVFITGMTGFGKTTTCKRLMLEAYEQHGMPFLVVEPAKAEYRELANLRALRGKLRVYAMGADSPLPFRLNPLQPVPGAPLARHIDLLKAVFNSSFPMFAGMTYILEEALYEVYRERGWSLYTSGNALLRERSSAEDIAALTPTLEDLHAKIDIVLGEKKYGKEVEQNLGAALRSRLKSLLVGNKGIMLNTRRSTPLEDLFRSPAVIELQNLGDDEEKGFVMALLFVLLYEYAEVRQRDVPAETRGKLQHLTLIEEAHRLLQAGGARASSETADPRGKAVAMFTDMLAEMRAYGEGFIIADQSPTKLVNAVLKNSALKIIHRLTYPDDRQAAGACVNLDHSQIQFLNDLPVGLAVVHDERIGQAVLTRIHPLASESETGGRTIDAIAGMDRRDRRLLHRHGGCEACLSPCDFFHRLDEFRTGELQSRNQRRFFDSLLIAEPEEAWGHWRAWRAQLPAERGLAYCIGATAAFDWLGRVLSARNMLFNPGGDFLAPEDHLRRDKAARSAARLISAWEGRRDLAADARLAFLNTQEELRRLVASAPPVEQPGCARCPARCDMLPFAAPSVRSLEKSLNGKLLGERGMTPAQHLRSIQNWLGCDPGLDLEARGLQPHLREWTYCLMTNSSLPSQTSTRRDKLLLELLQPAS